MTKIAVGQILSTNDVPHNLAVASRVVREASAAGATTIFLPEAADYIATSAEEAYELAAPPSKHVFLMGLQGVAKELGVTISVGIHDLPEVGEADDEPAGSKRVFNTHVLIGTDGELLATYRKIHLYDVDLVQPDGRVKRIGESDRVRPGQELVAPVPVPGLGSIGLEICYDIRFPEMHIMLTRLGADILTFPSSFTLKTGKDHWGTLLRGIAIQYQVYVIAAAQFGQHNPSRASWGESLAFDPFEDARSGDIDRTYAESGEFFLADVDADVIWDTRKQIPLSIQKRADIYGVVGEELPGR